MPTRSASGSSQDAPRWAKALVCGFLLVGSTALLAPAQAPDRAPGPQPGPAAQLGHGAQPSHIQAEPIFKHGDWPFSPPTRPSVPVVQDSSWTRNPIDAFILSKLEAKDLRPAAEADRLTLLRRVTYDLTGLFPTRAEQAAFLADSSPEAYETVVRRLLGSPRYGERLAQHWLDLVRYSETDGFKADDLRPDAFRYRDYVIQSFNEDLPYDRFISQQIAGDELEPGNPAALVATGLNRLYPDEYNAANLEQRRQEILDDVTRVNGLVFLGLTMGCAQCHDHKFDLILQTDYFKLQAFFSAMQPHDDLFAAPPEVIADYKQRQAAWDEATKTIRDELETLVRQPRENGRNYTLGRFRDEIQEAYKTPAERRTPYQEIIAAMAGKQVTAKDDEAYKKLKGDAKKRYDELVVELSKFHATKPVPPPRAMAIRDIGPAAPPTHVLVAGNWNQPQDEVAPGFPEFLSLIQPRDETLSRQQGPSTGRRATLAKWLSRPEHPLTPRVMVNRLWQYHFGYGIVGSPNDFGFQGDPPTHPELLDWLAVELVERGWSLKHLNYLMVTSAAYRQTSLVDPEEPAVQQAQKADPQNHLLWHARRRRLEGEAIRDNLLQLSGELNLRMYGPSARPALPAGVQGHADWKVDKNLSEQQRRSVYVFAKRNLRYPLFDAFDFPDMFNSCPTRSVTTTATQSLILLNGEDSLDRARKWTGRLLAEFGTDQERLLAAAYAEAFGREASRDELSAAADFVRSQAERLANAPVEDAERSAKLALPVPMPAQMVPSQAAALVDFCHALTNANEFLYVD